MPLLPTAPPPGTGRARPQAWNGPRKTPNPRGTNGTLPDALHDAVAGTGCSDFANQINNILAFPGLFRGLLDAQSHKIANRMLVAAATARAAVINPEELNATYIVPSVFHPGVTNLVAEAMANVAREDAVKPDGDGK